jgi:glycerophosphoryl diester phosphodiesterase
MSKIVTLLFLGTALLVCAPSTSLACSCDDFPNHKKDFKSAKAVFVGSVLAIEKQLPIPEALDGQVPEVAYAVRLEIEKSWKGQNTGQVVVWLHTSSLTCATWQFRSNERYLIYAREYKGTLIVHTWCSRTRPLERNNAQTLREYKELDGMRAKNSRL